MAPIEPVVLIVEDEPAIAELVKYSLCQDGWTCHVAVCVADAWEFIQRQRPDVVMLDWILRNESGMRLLARIRNDADVRDLPVIFLTCRTRQEDVAIGMANGADDFITKPFSPRELGVRVRAVLRSTVSISPSDAVSPELAGRVQAGADCTSNSSR